MGVGMGMGLKVGDRVGTLEHAKCMFISNKFPNIFTIRFGSSSNLNFTFIPPVPPVISSSLTGLKTIHSTECMSADTENTSWKFRLKTCGAERKKVGREQY